MVAPSAANGRGRTTLIRTARHATAIASAAEHQPDLRDEAVAVGSGVGRRRRRPHLSRRAQWLRQVDAAARRCRARRARRWRAFRSARREAQLFAAGAGAGRVRDNPSLCRGRVRRSRGRSTPGPLSAQGARPFRRGRSRGADRRRDTPLRAGPGAGSVARHPAARRADQPARPPRHRMAGERVGRRTPGSC